MERDSEMLTSGQQARIELAAKRAGTTSDVLLDHFITHIEDHARRYAELKAAIQEGIDSGDDGPLDMEDIIKEARVEWEHSKQP